MICVGKSKFGKGIFATKKINKFTLITHYLGILISIPEYKTRKDTRYMMSYNRNNVLDGNIDCNKARFINHSNNPNCQARDNSNGIGIYATRNIQQGEELFLNYGYSNKDIENDKLFDWYKLNYGKILTSKEGTKDE